MATLAEQRYSTEYTGLISTASLALGVMTVMLVAFETFGKLPRNLARKKRPGSENEPPSIEDYTMAYLYRPRAFLGKHRGPQIPKWPLLWVWQVLQLSQDWYLRNTGLDSAVYVRFVTGCWYFMLSQLLTTVVILLPLYISYAPDNVLPSSIAQASISSLVNSTTGGRKYLWVRTVLLWWQTICWITVVVYVGWGNIRMRREQILDPLQDAKDADRDEEDLRAPVEGMPPGLNTRGWRFRTVKVSNIPPHMRNEQGLRTYFDSCLAFLKKNPTARFYEAAMPSNPTSTSNSPAIGTTEPETRPESTSTVDHVVVVRKLTELHELVEKRKDVQHQLESAHVLLAREVMSAVAARLRVIGHQLTVSERVHQSLSRKKPEEDSGDLDLLVESLGQFLQVDSREAKIWQEMHPEKRATLPTQTIWEAMSELPSDILDAYQPVVKLKFFRGQVAPSIDYHLTKLNLLTSLVDDLRSRPDSYTACDTAFVTFARASDARLAKRELSWIRARGLTCRVRMAPDTRDLDWNKLVESNFRGDVFRGFITHALVWIATVIWILPMGALVGLVSLDNLSTRIPALARWLTGHQKAKSLGSTLIPTIIVAVVNMLVPTIIIQVSNRGQTFVTLSKLHHATWCRYWKWVVINVVIAFCAGTALFTSILGIFTGSSFSNTANNPLNIIASSFSNGAVFFVSYTILIIGTQCFFELGQFTIPWFLYLGVRKATTPRQRFTKTEGRRFFSYTISANHTLVIGIILTFSLLNPLPICFAFLYFSFATVVFRDHFARLYWRVYYEQSGRLFYMRTMRYSLDALVLGQVVNMALFFVLKDPKNGGACAALIPITIIVKLTLTRWYDAHMDAAEAAFADVVCRQGSDPHKEKEVPLDDRDNHAGRKARRLAINEKLKDFHLPELSLGATLRIPLSSRGTLKAQRGPQAVLQRFAKRLQTNGAYAELRDSALARQDANLHAAKGLAAPSAEKTLEALEDPGHKGFVRSRDAASLHLPQQPTALVVPHPKLQRDDRPDFSAPYIDPFLTAPVEHFLWLPRDPLYGIDLDDTIEWYGRALVSSEGGDGQIGGWNPQDDDEEEEEQEIIIETPIHEEPPTGLTIPASPSRRAGTPSMSGFSGSPRRQSRLDGSEKIRLANVIASKHLVEEPEQMSTTTPSVLRKPSTASSLARTFSSSPSPAPLTSSSAFLSPAPSTPEPGRFQRSASIAHVGPGETSDPIQLSAPPHELRRVRSEIIDPAEKQQVRRRPTLVLPPVSPNKRGRSGSNATGGSKTPLVSQSRALAHEVIQEEREQAVQRRKQEDKRMHSKLSNSRSRIRNLFYKAPDNAD